MREQVLLLLRLGAAGADQLGRDLRARAERADADIAARQFLGDDAHGELAHAEPAPLLRHGQAEHAEIGHLLHHRQRDQLVAQMPAMRMRRRPRCRRSGGTGRRTSSSASSSRPSAPKSPVSRPSAISSAMRPPHGRCVAGDQLRDGRRCRAPRASRPRSAGRTISTWLMAMPPLSCARYSPKADLQDQLLELAAGASPRPSAASGAAPPHRSRSRRSRARRTARAPAASDRPCPAAPRGSHGFAAAVSWRSAAPSASAQRARRSSAARPSAVELLSAACGRRPLRSNGK